MISKKKQVHLFIDYTLRIASYSNIRHNLLASVHCKLVSLPMKICPIDIYQFTFALKIYNRILISNTATWYGATITVTKN